MDNPKAFEKLAENIRDYRTLTDDPTNSGLAKSILAAIQSDPLAYVKPKPLEWGGDYNAGAETSFGSYSIRDTLDDRFEWAFTSRGDWDVSDCSYPTLEAAQAAAETHRNEMLKKEFVG